MALPQPLRRLRDPPDLGPRPGRADRQPRDLHQLEGVRREHLGVVTDLSLVTLIEITFLKNY